MARRATKRGPGRFSQEKETNLISLPTVKRTRPNIKILPRNTAQEDYLYALSDPDNSIIFATGPAGTGKTLIATLWALKGLISGEFKKIIITRPNIAVDDKDIGFLPGDIMEKMDPWIKPITSEFLNYYSKDELTSMFEEEIIEVVPVAYMRGRTFRDAIILVDEAQNLTPLSMLSVLTRIGDNSKMVVTGDINQSDRKGHNGLSDFLSRFKKSKQIAVVQFSTKHVERHPAVKEILDLYTDIAANL